MILISLAFLIAYGMNIMPFKSFNESYLSRNTTTAIKGVFVFLVFMSHFSHYYPLGANPCDSYYFIKHHSGQLVVTMFLFYSGYGIYESIKRKGIDYIKSFPKNRLLKTFFHFSVAILLFLILGLILGYKIKPLTLLLSFTGWSSIGNSNWFMFAIFIQYFIVFISFIIFREHRLPALAAVTALSVAYILILMKFKPSYWYNTALCLPFGMWYSFFKEKNEKAVMKNNITYFSFLAADTAVFLISYHFYRYFISYEIWTLSFTLLIVFISMKINVGNKALTWLGNHVFSLYILQRIPMNIFSKLDFNFNGHIVLCFAVCFIITVILAGLFDKAMGEIDKRIFRQKKKKEQLKETVRA